MTKVLVVAPASWGDGETMGLRTAIEGTGVEIMIGNDPDLIFGNDFVIIILDDKSQNDPRLLRVIGQTARTHDVKLVYANFPLPAVAAKIKTMVGGETLPTEILLGREALMKARKENPYFDQGGGCNW